MRGARNLFLAGALAAAVGCGLIPEQVPIHDASLGDDGRTLELEVGACNAQYTVDVDEAADTVTVTVTARGADGNDCMGQATVVLWDGLAGRTLVDGSTGDVVGVQ